MISELKHISLVGTSNVLNSALGFLSGVLIARLLGAEAFGSLAIFTASLGICLSLSGQGIDWATVRFAAKHSEHDAKKSNIYFKVMLKIRIVLCSIVVLGGFFLTELIAVKIFNNPLYQSLFRISAIAAVGSSFCFFILSYYQTNQQFLKFSIINFAGNGNKIFMLVLIVALGSLTLNTALAVYAISGYIGLLLGIYWMPKGVFKVDGNEREAAGDLLSMGGIMFITTLLDALYRRADILMIGLFSNTGTIGIYSAALNAFLAMDLLIYSAFTVLMSRVSRIRSKDEYKRYISDTLKISFIIGIPCIVLIFIAEPLVVFFYSDSFSESGQILKILCIGFLFSLVFQPMSLIFFAKDRPVLFIYIDLLLLTAVVIGHSIIIPRLGIVGAAYVTMGSRIFQGVLISIFSYFLIFKGSPEILKQET
ncbi:MAG: flippase [Desulfobacteraceae bacterium]|nr:flippase [Desulfobacteraceae bacterium]